MSARHLILADCGLDDLILGLTAFAALRQFHQDDHLELWTKADGQAFMRLSPYVDDVSDMPDVPWRFHNEAKVLHSHFEDAGYERVYDLFPTDTTARLHKLLQGVPLIRGKAGTAVWSGPYKEAALSTLALSGGLHTEQRLLAQVAAAGAPPDVHADLSWIGSQVEQFKLPVALDKRLVLIVMAQDLGWSEDRLNDFAAAVVKSGRTPVLLGTSDDRSSRIAENCQGVVDLTDRTSVTDAVCLAWAAEGALGPDAGLTHLIARAGCNTALLFGPGSDPAIRKPRVPSASVLQRHDLEAITVTEALQTLGLHLNVVDGPARASGSPFDAA